MNRIVAVCPSHRDHRELSYDHVRGDNDIIFHDYDQYLIDDLACGLADALPEGYEPEVVLKHLHAYHEHGAHGFFASDDYPGSIFSSLVAYQTGLPGPSPESVIGCQHKYYARMAQQAVVPEATPRFMIMDPQGMQCGSLPFPFFIKPIKSFFSLNAQRINSPEELKSYCERTRMGSAFFYQLEWFMKQYTPYELSPNGFIAEELLQGIQVTLEGHVYRNAVTIHGIVDSIMFPGTISFSRFEYPSSLPQGVQDRMVDIATRLIKGIHFDNGIFNIEFMYNPETDAIHIIEVNPRMASQFADLFEKVDGTNTYQVQLDLAVGKKPHYQSGNGRFAYAASCVMRLFEDQHVIKVPDAEDIERVSCSIPDIRIEVCAREGKKLSEELQDGASFRYGVVNIGARDNQELLETFDYCKRELPFIFGKA